MMNLVTEETPLTFFLGSSDGETMIICIKGHKLRRCRVDNSGLKGLPVLLSSSSSLVYLMETGYNYSSCSKASSIVNLYFRTFAGTPPMIE